MFLENQIYTDPKIEDEQISRAISNDHTAAMKAPSDGKKHKKKGSCVICLVCQKAFKSAVFYRKHMRLHADKPHRNNTHRNFMCGVREFSCHLCPKSFSIKSSLQRHLGCHTGEKPFVCGLCQRGYTRRSVLLLHVQQVHEERKPFQCSVCLLCFSQKGNLQAHFRRKHLPANPKGKETQKRRKPTQETPKGTSSSIHSYATKVKAIVSRGAQASKPSLEPQCTSYHMKYHKSSEQSASYHSISRHSTSSLDSSSLSEGGEDVSPLPELNSLHSYASKVKAIVSHVQATEGQRVKGKYPKSSQQSASPHTSTSRGQTSASHRIVGKYPKSSHEPTSYHLKYPKSSEQSTSYHSISESQRASGKYPKSSHEPTSYHSKYPKSFEQSTSYHSTSSLDSSSDLSEEDVPPLPDLDSLLGESEGWEMLSSLLGSPYELLPPKCSPADISLGEWGEECGGPVFTADDLDEIKEIYGLEGLIKLEPCDQS